jgi:hypothetical protein
MEPKYTNIVLFSKRSIMFARLLPAVVLENHPSLENAAPAEKASKKSSTPRVLASPTENTASNR